MAITRIYNIKTSGTGNPHSHMRRLIFYIAQPKKTEKCLWIHSNVGSTPAEVYQKFLDTKKDWQKLYGRQAYHIIISFKPGEGDPETAFLIGKEFCREFLGDAYDYEMGVHLDRAHLHIHIVFNSVNRISGLKYQYSNGDWEKMLQPLTDKLCKKHGLSILEYDKEKRVGISYGEDLARKEERPTNKDILQNDIDNAIANSSTFEEYLSTMRGYGYKIHIGHSQKRGCDYITYTSEWMKKGRRDYRLPEGYSMDAVKKRIGLGDKTIIENPVFPSASAVKDLYDKADTPLSIRYTSYVVCARFYHKVKTVKFSSYAIRRDLLDIQKLRQECAYIIDHKLQSIEDVKERLSKIKAKEREIKKEPSSDVEDALKAIRAEKSILRHILKREEEHLEQRVIEKEEALDILSKRISKTISKEVGRGREHQKRNDY